MVQARSKVAVYLLLLWLIFFLGKTLYPHARSFYKGVRGTEEHAWPETFRARKRLQRVVALTSPWTGAANRQILFAYGRNDAEPSTVMHFMDSIHYLLYPGHMFTHGRATAGFMTISN